MEQVKRYNYEWKTADEVIAHLHEKRDFAGWGIETLAELCGTDEESYRKADTLWQRLRAAFNKEAEHYDPETNYSKLGSVGDKARREVLRTEWWDVVKGDELGDYSQLTTIIEVLHNGEQLETGVILFGS